MRIFGMKIVTHNAHAHCTIAHTRMRGETYIFLLEFNTLKIFVRADRQLQYVPVFKMRKKYYITPTLQYGGSVHMCKGVVLSFTPFREGKVQYLDCNYVIVLQQSFLLYLHYMNQHILTLPPALHSLVVIETKKQHFF